jgi:hypothetical protein
MSKDPVIFYKKFRKAGKGGSYREMEWALRYKGVPEPHIVLVLASIRAHREEVARFNLSEKSRERMLLALRNTAKD